MFNSIVSAHFETMKLVALGIVFVAALQLAYVGYSSVDRNFMAVSRGGLVEKVKADSDRELLATLEPDDFTFATDTEEIAPTYRNDPERVVRGRAHEPRVERVVTNSKLFKDVVIVVAKPTAYKIGGSQIAGRSKESMTPPQAKFQMSSLANVDQATVSTEFRKRKGNSVLTKTAHVIKKPYDWLKSLAAKL